MPVRQLLPGRPFAISVACVLTLALVGCDSATPTGEAPSSNSPSATGSTSSPDGSATAAGVATPGSAPLPTFGSPGAASGPDMLAQWSAFADDIQAAVATSGTWKVTGRVADPAFTFEGFGTAAASGSGTEWFTALTLHDRQGKSVEIVEKVGDDGDGGAWFKDGRNERGKPWIRIPIGRDYEQLILTLATPSGRAAFDRLTARHPALKLGQLDGLIPLTMPLLSPNAKIVGPQPQTVAGRTCQRYVIEQPSIQNKKVAKRELSVDQAGLPCRRIGVPFIAGVQADFLDYGATVPAQETPPMAEVTDLITLLR